VRAPDAIKWNKERSAVFGAVEMSGINFYCLCIMKKNILSAFVLFFCIALMSSCEQEIVNGPEENTSTTGHLFRLVSEDEGNDPATKTSVKNTTVQWAEGDKIKVATCEGYNVWGAHEFPVAFDGGGAYIDLGSLSNQTNYQCVRVLCFYPNSTWIEGGYNHLTQAQCNDTEWSYRAYGTIPDYYESCYDANGRQVIALPMIAVADWGDETIYFKHLTAAVNVTVKNGMKVGDTEIPVTLDKVEVSTSENKYLAYLFGCQRFTFGNNEYPAVDPGYEGNHKSKAVTVAFTDDPVISYGNTRDVQVPVVPVVDWDSGKSIWAPVAIQLTIKVYVHSNVTAVTGVPGFENVNYEFVYTCSPDGKTTLPRNTIVKANIEVKRNPASPSSISEYDCSLFTVSSNPLKKVRFSHSNLQYTRESTSVDWNTGKFSLTEHAYSVVEQDDENYDINTKTAIGLFGWGTPNHKVVEGRNYVPWETDSERRNYGPLNANDGRAWEYEPSWDWGSNTIYKSDGYTTLPGSWRTPTKAEWSTIVNQRNTSDNLPGYNVTGANQNMLPTRVSYFYAKVCGKNGLILLPDRFFFPAGVTMAVEDGHDFRWYSSKDSYETSVIASQADWSRMEAAGAIFLPTTGRRVYEAGQLKVKYCDANNFSTGYYWSSSSYNTSSTGYDSSTSAYRFYFYSPNNITNASLNISEPWDRNQGLAVRLVQDM
jgi:hypothetical protein